MFKVGDVVICKRPTFSFNPDREGQVATITGFKGGNLVLSPPFNTESHYDSTAFDLYNVSLENK